MNSALKQQTADEETWFIIINEQTKGPLSLRDLDVMLRTNEITTRTYGWKNGMKEWKVLNDIEEIKNNVLQSWEQIREIQKSMIDPNLGNVQTGSKGVNESQNVDKDNDIIQNKDQNPLQILQLTVQSLLKKSFNQSQDGKWSIYDQKNEQWIVQQQQPTQMIQNMKHHLFNKLKAELFFDQKITKRKKVQIEKIPDEILTPQQLLKRQRNKKKTRRAIEKKKQKWYNAKINTFVYISGLPFDITEDQLKDFASKAGVLRIDLNTGREKIKIYKDNQGYPKGDAAVSYGREESVDIAVQNLNGGEIRNGFNVKVQRAQFNQKDEDYKPRQIKKQTKVKKIIAKKNEQKKLTWNDDQDLEQGDGFYIIILKHIFTEEQLQNNTELQQIRRDITDELQKIGPVSRIRFFETHPEGVVQVKYKNSKDAQECIKTMDGRFYDMRQIECDYWDGETNYKNNIISEMHQQQALVSLVEQIVQQQELVQIKKDIQIQKQQQNNKCQQKQCKVQKDQNKEQITIL